MCTLILCDSADCDNPQIHGLKNSTKAPSAIEEARAAAMLRRVRSSYGQLFLDSGNWRVLTRLEGWTRPHAEKAIDLLLERGDITVRSSYGGTLIVELAEAQAVPA